MSVFQRVVREPLVHFLLLAAVIFAVHAVLNRDDISPRERIEVSSAKIEQLAGLFAKSWQRLPTPAELQGLIDDHVKEEIYYREAKALGLDRDDTVIRRRLRLKMELLNEATVDQAEPADEELNAYLAKHADAFRIEPQVAFAQIFFSREKRGAALEADMAKTLEELRRGSAVSLPASGDSTLLPQSMPLSPVTILAREFGGDFANAVAALPPGRWQGPVASSYGLHLVFVTEKTDGRAAALGDVREAILREVRNEKLKAVEAARLAEMAARYNIVVELPSAPDAKP